MYMINTYDEFNIYSDDVSHEDIMSYIEELMYDGVEELENLYTLCIKKFGNTQIVKEIFDEAN